MNEYQRLIERSSRNLTNFVHTCLTRATESARNKEAFGQREIDLNGTRLVAFCRGSALIFETGLPKSLEFIILVRGENFEYGSPCVVQPLDSVEMQIVDNILRDVNRRNIQLRIAAIAREHRCKTHYSNGSIFLTGTKAEQHLEIIFEKYDPYHGHYGMPVRNMENTAMAGHSVICLPHHNELYSEFFTLDGLYSSIARHLTAGE